MAALYPHRDDLASPQLTRTGLAPVTREITRTLNYPDLELPGPWTLDCLDPGLPGAESPGAELAGPRGG